MSTNTPDGNNNQQKEGSTKPNEERKRTKDIQIDHDIDFSELLLSPPVLKGLNEAGYPYCIDLK